MPVPVPPKLQRSRKGNDGGVDLSFETPSLSRIYCSPGNPDLSGELTAHGLIPTCRDCSNQHHYLIKFFSVIY